MTAIAKWLNTAIRRNFGNKIEDCAFGKVPLAYGYD